ncbi:hypothetical protein MFLAVUS_005649 [Mucor flavus]|uniref:Ion transport domain-containing protein n=1 Tax=Mucor flavus TaxID=439312 RepID=A0ABP9YZB9_9FUNG
MKDKLGCNTETDTASLKFTKKKNESNDVFKDKIIYQSSKEGSVSSKKCEMMETNENVLTVLIEESSYDLFKLLFNRILFDSKTLGPGCLSALTDALVFLQDERNSDSQKESANIRNLETHAMREQLTEYRYKFSGWNYEDAIYSTGVLFSRTLYVKGENYEFDMKHPGHIVSLAVMGLSLAVLIYKETQQFFSGRSKMNYNEVCSVTTLILWLHGILRFRVNLYFGVTLEIIIQLFKNVFSVLFIMLLVVIAFTQAFVVLLRTEGDEYFRDNFPGNFTGNTTLATSIVSTEGLTDSANVSADNGFVNWFKAFSQVWFFLYGVWDPVMEGKAGDSKMLMSMCILFSFITVLIFFNMVIALMSSTVEDVKKRGKRAWVSHFAAVVSEIELLWCSDEERHTAISDEFV